MANSKTLLNTPEEIRAFAETLQEDFLREHSDNSLFDPRDIGRVRNNISYVEKFVIHHKRSPDNIMQHMVDCLSWRKSFGINDVKFEDIDEALWRTEMAYNHGFDVNGHNVVILNICKHRKDSKKALQLQRWIAFCFEMHQTVYPQNRMCMVFDMSGAGLSQMDMDLIRFIINCFKTYFPNLMEWLLIFNMPWILQAAWKIVQSWLSEAGAAKVKFVTVETIVDYIPADNLLAKYGGNDTWEFVYEVERETMLNLLREAGIKSQQEADGDISDEDDEEEEREEEEDESVDFEDGDERALRASGSRDSLKQVRFSSGLPPSRQSRFGEDGDAPEFLSLQNSNQVFLKRGSASSSGFRRRQVSRLMSLQETPQGRSLPREPNGNVPTAKQQMTDKVVGDCLLSPSHELLFQEQKEGEVLATLTLKNTSDNPVAYKVKTTAPLQYKVRPNLAVVDSKSVAKIQVLLTHGYEIQGQDKFQVQTYTFPSSSHIPKSEELAGFWRTLPLSATAEHKMRCRLLSDTSARQSLKTQSEAAVGAAAVGGGGQRNGPRKGSATLGTKPPSQGIELKVQEMLNRQVKLSQSLTRLQRLNYLSLIVLVCILFYLIMT